jgi:hypothetical protein
MRLFLFEIIGANDFFKIIREDDVILPIKIFEKIKACAWAVAFWVRHWV